MYKIQRIVILVTALFFLALFGFGLFDVFTGSILSIYNVHWKIRIISENFIDFYGAIIPTVFSLFIVFYIVYFRGFPFRNYVSHFLLSIVFGFMTSTVSPNAVVTFYKFFAFLVSFLVVFITFYDGGLVKFLKSHDFDKLDFTKRNYFNALLIAYSYASLSILIVDLAYIPFAVSFSVSFYIGGMGLTDGIMLSGLIIPLCVTFVTILVLFLYEMRTHNKGIIREEIGEPNG